MLLYLDDINTILLHLRKNTTLFSSRSSAGRRSRFRFRACLFALIRGYVLSRNPLLCLNRPVPRKRKKLKKFTATKAVKSMARTALGSPPPVQREESKKRPGKQKHRTTLARLLSESDSG